MDFLRKSQLARKVHVNSETIRYYERRGLIPKPERNPSGHRKYSADYVVRIQFIKRAQALGFTLNEIKELLFLRVDSENSCDQVREKAEIKIAEIEKKMADLAKMKRALQALTAVCQGSGTSGDCPILEALESDKFSVE